MIAEVLGWLASIVLLATMVRQVHTQWRDRSAKGVSHWLFVGQIAASAMFTAYSLLLHNMVFVVTNALLLVNAVLGLYIDRRNRKISRDC